MDPDGGWDHKKPGVEGCLDCEFEAVGGVQTIVWRKEEDYFFNSGLDRPASSYMFPSIANSGYVGMDVTGLLAQMGSMFQSQINTVRAGDAPDDWFYNKQTGELKWFDAGMSSINKGGAWNSPGENWGWGTYDISVAEWSRDLFFSNNTPKYKTEIPKGNGSNWLSRATIATHQADYQRDPSYLYDFADAYPHVLTHTVSALFMGGDLIELGLSAHFGLQGLLSTRAGRATVLGTDPKTASNALRLVSNPRAHQILVHGTEDGFIYGIRTDLGVDFNAKQLSRILLSRGFKRGTPIELISCTTGIFRDGAAYQLSRYLRSPVTAPTNLISVEQGGTYLIRDGGIFKTYFNTTIK